MSGLLPTPRQYAADANGAPLSGAKLFFYESGTTTPKEVFSNSALSTPLTQPVVANSAGEWPAIYLGAGDHPAAVTGSGQAATLKHTEDRMDSNLPPMGPNDNLPAVLGGATPIAYKGVPVMTTERLAGAYGTDEKVVQNNYARNQGRFREGVHFFKIAGSELRSLKTDPLWEGQFDKRAPALILWTERGARRHAKILDNDVAWSVFEELEDSYFAAKVERVEAAAKRPLLGTLREVGAAFKGFFGIARMVGLDANQAALAASRGVKNTVGVDPLGEMGVTHLLAPQQEAHLTATQIGAKISERTGAGKVSAQAANKLLEKHGFQMRDANSDAGWADTEKGRPYAVWQDTAKHHGSGTPIRQLRWSAGIVDALIAAMAEAPSREPDGEAQH